MHRRGHGVAGLAIANSRTPATTAPGGIVALHGHARPTPARSPTSGSPSPPTPPTCSTTPPQRRPDRHLRHPVRHRHRRDLDRGHPGRRHRHRHRHRHRQQPRHRQPRPDRHRSAPPRRATTARPAAPTRPAPRVTRPDPRPDHHQDRRAPAATVPGATVGYTITITDTGQTPYTGAIVTDSFAGLTDDAAYDSNATATAGTLSYDSRPHLTWTGNLAAGDTATITYTVTVNNPDTGDKLIINTVTSAATGSTCPPATTRPACRVTVPVLTPALNIVKTASPATAVPGATVTYTITATDTGQTPYTGATFTDSLAGVLDDAAYNNDAAATSRTTHRTPPRT